MYEEQFCRKEYLSSPGNSRSLSELRISALPCSRSLLELRISTLPSSRALSELRILVLPSSGALSELRISALPKKFDLLAQKKFQEGSPRALYRDGDQFLQQTLRYIKFSITLHICCDIPYTTQLKRPFWTTRIKHLYFKQCLIFQLHHLSIFDTFSI